MDKTYTVELLFDGKSTDKATLQRRIKSEISKFIESGLKTRVSNTKQGHIKLVLTGTENVIDGAHAKVSFALSALPHFRLRDDLSNELRQRAYPILAQLEHDFRVFIQQALVELEGFSWTEEAQRLQRINPKKLDRNRSGSFGLHFLEQIDFTDLLGLITNEVPEWDIKQPGIAKNLFDLMGETTSWEQFRSTVKDKTRPRSYWIAFEQFFHDIQAWRSLEVKLHEVIEIRNAVMHHRPIQSRQLELLSQTTAEIDSLLRSARKNLTEEQREVARRNAPGYAEVEAYSRMIERLSAQADIYSQMQERFSAYSRMMEAFTLPSDPLFALQGNQDTESDSSQSDDEGTDNHVNPSEPSPGET